MQLLFFAYPKTWFSHDAAQVILSYIIIHSVPIMHPVERLPVFDAHV